MYVGSTSAPVLDLLEEHMQCFGVKLRRLVLAGLEDEDLEENAVALFMGRIYENSLQIDYEGHGYAGPKPARRR